MQKSSIKTQKLFIVKDDKSVSLFAGAVFWIMFFSAVYYNNFSHLTTEGSINLLYITVFPAIFFTIRALRNKIIIKINEDGFYYYGSLITNWENLISARYAPQEMDGNISDDFTLYLEYYNPDKGTYLSKVPLENTQDKSEEDVMTAINSFWNANK
ncbi:MAG: hypothetical protein ABI091_12730 [Ferruginibacter sp.]